MVLLPRSALAAVASRRQRRCSVRPVRCARTRRRSSVTESVSLAGPDPERGQTTPEGDAQELSPAELEALDGEIVEDRPGGVEHRVITASRFRGPLPAPEILREYDDVLPGLAREIVDQWKGETAHRHETITSLRNTDYEAMRAYYAGEKRGQVFALICFLALIAVGVLALILDQELAGAAAIVGGGAGVIWSMRRSPHTPGTDGPPVQLDDPDAVETEAPDGSATASGTQPPGTEA